MRAKPRRRAPAAALLHSALVATDFSENADHAVERALRLPLAEGAELTLLHVEVRRRRGAGVAEHAAAERRLAAAAARARRIAGADDRSDLRIQPKLAAGEVFVEIVRRARRAGVELIVLGRHGPRPIRDLFLGSTADRVIRHGSAPTLIVGPHARGPYARPVLALDLEETSRRAVPFALRLLRTGTTVTLVHAYEAPFERLATLGLETGAQRGYRSRFEAAARRRLAPLEALVGRHGVRWRTELRLGPARLVLPRAVHGHRADLLVLGSHARSGLSHALLGSVAGDVMREVKCDVLIVRPRHTRFVRP
jgi:nucleotide-binding universal stress UspA family protein